MLCFWDDGHEDYYVVKDAQLYLLNFEGPFSIHYDEKDSTSSLINYYKLSPSTKIYDSLVYGIMVSPDIDYCNDCSEYTAFAAIESGLNGTQQKIKRLQLFIIDNVTKRKRDISVLPFGNDSLKIIQWKQDSLYSVFCCGVPCNNCDLNPADSYSNLAAFKDTFNLNRWEGHGLICHKNLIFRFSKETIQTFPQDFDLRLEIEFEGGKKIASEVKAKKE
jgi:hypothetical protein